MSVSREKMSTPLYPFYVVTCSYADEPHMYVFAHMQAHNHNQTHMHVQSLRQHTHEEEEEILNSKHN